jgi:hypothetical protein
MNIFIRILSTVLITIMLTTILYFIKNRSNLPSKIAVPFLVTLLTKYIIGDWDKGFQWSTLDIPYWVCVFSVSYATLFLLIKEKF